jgi:DNA-directed RNA polymerase specialized sigma24 family protein
MVELLRRYSNRDDLLKPLISVMQHLREDAPAEPEEAQLTSADGSAPHAWQVSDRLTTSDVETLIKSYLAGSTIAALAERQSISVSSVKRLLRQHGARKQRPRSAA